MDAASGEYGADVFSDRYFFWKSSSSVVPSSLRRRLRDSCSRSGSTTSICSASELSGGDGSASAGNAGSSAERVLLAARISLFEGTPPLSRIAGGAGLFPASPPFNRTAYFG